MSSFSRRRPTLVAAAVAAVMAVTATACGPEEDGPDAKPPAASEDVSLPRDLPTSLEDLKEWKDGAWKDWSKEKWFREAAEFINPIIEGLWDLARMLRAKEPERDVDESEVDEGGNDGSGDEGVTDPTPRPVQAQPVQTPYAQHAAPVGKVFFDTPDGQAVCSGAVVKDPNHPGKSNLVATAGHCVHAGKEGGWYRNIMFVPNFNNKGLPTSQLEHAPLEDVAPHGKWWAEWAATSDYWIKNGTMTGGNGAPIDFAVMKVKPEKGGGKSLEETVGGALDVNFDQPSVSSIGTLSSHGYPAAPPYDGTRMFQCTDRPTRLTLDPNAPTMYRIGCTMTGGSSGGPWIHKGRNGKLTLFSVNSIGPADSTWLAGPRLGTEAKQVYLAVSKKFAQQ